MKDNSEMTKEELIALGWVKNPLDKMQEKTEKQLTAVEWFFKQLTEVDYGCINKTFLQNNNTLAGHKLRELLDKAKEMEKEQRKKCFFDGKLMCINNKDISFEDYELGNFNNPRVHFATKQQEQ